MTTTITEQTETAPADTTAEPKATKNANARTRGAHVAPKKGKAGRKAAAAKKGALAKAAKSKKPAAGGRDGSKTQHILELLKRPGGATAQELMKATGWQGHSVRGFLSGTISKKMGLAVTSMKREDGERTYSVKA